MPRDNVAGSSSRSLVARESIFSRSTLTTRKSHRTIDLLTCLDFLIHVELRISTLLSGSVFLYQR
jgi:hypothetical protein